MKKKLNGFYNYTVILTYLGMLFGFAGIAFVIEGKFRRAVLSLMIAGFCDMFDGAVASTRERTDSEKKFGIQIDSLSDLICFGIMPGLFIYCLCGRHPVAFFVAGLYALCALIRLAYFNVMEEQRQSQESGRRTDYQGLPVTVSAILVPLIYLIFLLLPRWNIAFALLALSFIAAAFVLPFRVRKPHSLGKLFMVIAAAVELVLILLNFGAKA